MGSVERYLDEKVASAGEFENVWIEMRNFYNKKLWHQLTQLLMEEIKKPEFKARFKLHDVYLNLISSLVQKMKPLSLTEIAIVISEELVASDPDSAIEFMEQIKGLTTSCAQSQILCGTVIGMINLKAKENLEATREIVENLNEKITTLDSVTSIHSRYYELSASYYQKIGKHTEYYREGLKYLGCSDLSQLSDAEKQSWAFLIGLAALLSDDIYNFGELITHEIFASLKNTKNSWLIDLMEGLSHGELKKFEDLSPQWHTQPDLKNSEKKLLEKATVLCLIELIFRRSLNKRTISFKEISQATKVPVDQVEYLVMRALSLKLIEGRIDEIDHTVTITWLQPRVLDYHQLGSMSKQLDEWCNRVTSMREMVEVDSKTLLA